jgi:hypothetical protein
MSLVRTTILAGACLAVVVFFADSAFSMSGWDPSWKQADGNSGGTSGGTRSVFEPSTALLIGSGIAGAAALRWIRSRKK